MNQSRTLDLVNPKPLHILGSGRALVRCSAIHAVVGASLLANAVLRRASRVRQQAGSYKSRAAWGGHGDHALTSSSANVAQTLSTSSTLVMPLMA